jgi:hypothetical protein
MIQRRSERASPWLVANAPRAWGFLLVAVVTGPWNALRGIHIHEVRATLRALDDRWLAMAAAVTLANVAIMGLYDVVAFRHTRTRAAERWRYGSVAFCWSNFLTLGPLGRITLEGHAGKMNRQYRRRAERDGIAFRVLEPPAVAARMTELAEVSDHWLRTKGVIERQFSIGYFDPSYLRRFRCAVVEQQNEGLRIMGFANLMEGPRHEELSVDLMRYRADGPPVMDYLITSIMLWGKDAGYRSFNLGMAPLASVGEHRGAHRRERLSSLVFRRGEQWYNFQGVRRYKQKFDPEWLPRYMAYEAAWEWPVSLANVSALIAASWKGAVFKGNSRESNG